LEQEKGLTIEAGKRRALWPWPSGPRPETHLPARMTEGGGAVKPSQWDYEHSEIILMLPRRLGVVNCIVEYYISPEGLKQILEKYRNQNIIFEI